MIEMILPEKDVLELFEDEFVLPAKGGKIFLDIEYSREYSVNIDVDEEDVWIHQILDETKGAQAGVLCFEVDANSGYDARYAIIEVSISSDIKKYVNITQKQKDALILSKEFYEFDEEGGDMEIEVHSNVKISVDIDDEASQWITQPQTKGLEADVFSFSVAPYEGTSVRSGKIVFYSGNLREEVTVYQKGEPKLVLSKDLVNLSAPEGKFTIDVTSNVPYEVVMPDVDWLECPLGTKSIVTNSLEFSVKENYSYDYREAVIVIRSKDKSLSESVTVVQAQKDAIVVAASKIEIGSSSGSFTLTLGSNVDYEMSIDADWLAPVRTKALEEDILEFVYEANDESAARKAIITFKYKDVMQEVTVLQFAPPKEYVLSVKHKNALFMVPEFIGTLQYGTVYWGDGSVEDYSLGLEHHYSEPSEVQVLMKFNADISEHLLRLENIDGIVEIDLSGM